MYESYCILFCSLSKILLNEYFMWYFILDCIIWNQEANTCPTASSDSNLEKTRFSHVTLRISPLYPTRAWSFDLLTVNDTQQHGLHAARLTAARRGAPIYSRVFHYDNSRPVVAHAASSTIRNASTVVAARIRSNKFKGRTVHRQYIERIGLNCSLSHGMRSRRSVVAVSVSL